MPSNVSGNDNKPSERKLKDELPSRGRAKKWRAARKRRRGVTEDNSATECSFGGFS